eukprot:GFUD01038374.1.p1 GENE.GFUD01038374.1~~GFUD01038374.1.p1  ORF type:complete len:311 (-),score=78.94 GFUD01038374.1:64-996(-)
MKKDLPWTRNNAVEQMTHDNDNDTRQPTQYHDKGASHQTNKSVSEEEKHDNDNKTVQRTQDTKIDSGHLTQEKHLRKKIQDKKSSRQQIQNQDNTNSNVTTRNQLKDNVDGEKLDKIDKKTPNPKGRKKHEQICTTRKIKNPIQISLEKKRHQYSRSGEIGKLIFTFLIFIPVGHSYIIKEKGTNINKILSSTETVKNIGEDPVEDIDNDSITYKGLNSTTKTPCICPTTGQAISSSSTSSQSSSPGPTTPHMECICPDNLQSISEEETSTSLPVTNGRRRRRKEISEMDLFVDKFDQKILKKMPFLESY